MELCGLQFCLDVGLSADALKKKKKSHQKPKKRPKNQLSPPINTLLLLQKTLGAVV